MPEGGGENLPVVVSKINDPAVRQELQRKTADLMVKGVPNDPKQGKDGTARRGVAESLTIRDMAGKRYIHRQTEKREEAEKLSLTDPLTGLLNRRAMSLILTKEINQAKRSGKPLSVGIIDLDDFSGVNNSKGHPTGDEVLQRVSRILDEQLRGTDFIFKGRGHEPNDSEPTDENTNSLSRHGGEEFLIALPDVGSEGALEIGERINWALSTDKKIFDLAGRSVTASVGLAVMGADGSTNPSSEELIANADAALYQVKRDGKDASILYQPGMIHPTHIPPEPNSPK